MEYLSRNLLPVSYPSILRQHSTRRWSCFQGQAVSASASSVRICGQRLPGQWPFPFASVSSMLSPTCRQWVACPQLVAYLWRGRTAALLHRPAADFIGRANEMGPTPSIWMIGACSWFLTNSLSMQLLLLQMILLIGIEPWTPLSVSHVFWQATRRWVTQACLNHKSNKTG